MIDIIICINGQHNKLDKMLLSVLLQTIKDKVNVYIVDNSNFNYANIIEKFSNKIQIKVFKVDSNYTFSDMKQFGIEKSVSKYIMFLSSNELIYNCFSLKYMIDAAEEQSADVVYGNVVISDFCAKNVACDNLFAVVGKIFRRDFIVNNNIHFCNINSNEDCSFYGICYMLATNICYCNYNVIYSDKNLVNKDYFNSIVDNIKCAILFCHNNNKKYLRDVIKYLYNVYVNDNCSDELLSLIHSIEKLYLE